MTSPLVEIDTTLRRARLATAAAFATQGLVFISLTTRLPDFSDHWDLDDTELSGLLLMMVLLAGVGSVIAEQLAKRHDSATLLRAGLVVIAVGVPVLALAPAFGFFVGGLACYGVGLGMVDASTNMQAVALEHRYGRPILPSFHGAWTLGGLIGSVITLGTSSLPRETVAVLALIPLVVATRPFLRRVGDPVASGPKVAVPWRPILLVGLGMVIFYMVDTAAFTWGPTYLDHVFSTPESLVALATFPYLLASGTVRLAGDNLVSRYGAVPVLRVGAVIGCLGLAIIVFAPVWPVAVLGFLVVGGGVAVVAPLSFSAAARIAGAGGDQDPVARQARVDAVIGRFNQFNYVGSLLGAVMTGLVGAGDLRIGFAVPMVLVLALVPLASAFAPRAAPL
ncbi:MFS transporter [Marmoricola sp. RAF53]|uniref:MFS transporter n=1 Tax=Marmoricola sp. RAF53 TaxID=3233059 RepID=UPI003F96673D